MKTIKVREFEIPVSAMPEVADILEKSELGNSITGTDEDHEFILVEVSYDKDDEDERSANKQRIQYLLFPDGIYVNKETQDYRTPKINAVFLYFARLKRVLAENESGKTNSKVNFPASVVRGVPIAFGRTADTRIFSPFPDPNRDTVPSEKFK